MKSWVFGAAALVLATVGPAAARDLEAAMPMDQWTGAFVGGHIGVGQGNRNGCFNVGLVVLGFPFLNADPIQSCDDPTNGSFEYNQSGGLVGVQAGYNWKPAQSFLLGVEASASALGITGELDGVMGGEGNWNSLLTATVKAGVTKDNWLFYVEGGYAVATAGFAGDLDCNFSVTHNGPVAGAGIGYKLSDRVSIDLKYEHVWLGAQNSQCVDSVLGDVINVPLQLRTQGSLDVVKLGLNFRLGGP